MAQIGAQATFSIGARRQRHGAQGGQWNLAAPGLQQGQLRRIGHAARLAIGIAEQALHAPVGAIKHLAVHPFVVQSQTQRLAHPQILQQRLAGVEHIALETGGHAVCKFGLDQLTGIELAAIDAPGPVAGRKESHQVEFARLQCFQSRRLVLVNLDRDAIKVEHAAPHIQVLGPIGRIAHIGDVPAKQHRPDFVGAAANGNVHHHLVKRFALPPAVAEHRQAADDEWQFAIRLFKAVAHGQCVDHLDRSHIFQGAA